MRVVITQSDLRCMDNHPFSLILGLQVISTVTVTDTLFVIILGIPITVPPPGKVAYIFFFPAFD